MADNPAVQSSTELVNKKKDLEERLAESSVEEGDENLWVGGSTPVTGSDEVEEPIDEELHEVGLSENEPVVDQLEKANPNPQAEDEALNNE